MLLAVAHGSRDPGHAQAVQALLERVRTVRPGMRTVVAFLDHCGPSVPQVVRALAAQGVREVVAVPLLLTAAYHATTDMPAVLAEASRHRIRVHRAAALGPSALLVSALEERLREVGVRPGDDRCGVVLASAGSSDPEANAVITDVAREWRRTGWCAVVPAFASTRTPGVGDAVATLRAAGTHRVVVACYLLAPGVLPSRVTRQAREAGADAVTATLADTAATARLVWLRYDEALPAALPHAA